MKLTASIFYKLACTHKDCKHFMHTREMTKQRLKDRVNALVVGIEQVISKDPKATIEELINTRESYWINKYDSVRYGGQCQRLIFLKSDFFHLTEFHF